MKYSSRPGEDIVIVGAGPSGMAALHALTKLDGLRSVTVLDEIAAGYGIAFGERCSADPVLLCNTPIATTSIDADAPQDLLDYLTSRGWPVAPDDVVPRYLIGEYAHFAFQRAARILREKGVRVGQIRTRARTVERRDEREYVVELHDGTHLIASAVVLCTGLETPNIPPTLEPFRDSDLLVRTYPTSGLRDIPAGSKVLLMGMRVSALDAALVLGSSGHEVVMTSPSGRLPAVRENLRASAEPIFDRERLAALRPDEPNLAANAFAILGEAIEKVSNGIPLAEQISTEPDGELRLRQEITIAEQGKARWSYVLHEAIGLLNEVTGPWPAAQRRAALALGYYLMTRYVASIPLLNARRLLRDIERGTTRMSPVFPTAFDQVDGAWKVTWPDGRTEEFDRVVLATGYFFPRFPLVGERAIEIDNTGAAGNLATLDADLRVQFGEHSPAERIWALGAASNQRLPVAHVIWIAAREARQLARQLAGDNSTGIQQDTTELVGQGR